MKAVTIGFTTIPSRVSGLTRVIDSLLDQKVSPKRVVVSLPFEFENPVFGNLKRRFGESLTIHKTKDRGAFNKLAGLLEATDGDEEFLVTVDDDRVYGENLVSDFLKQHETNPDAVLGFRGRTFPKNTPYKKSKLLLGCREGFLLRGVKRAVQVDLLTGTGGVFYPRKFFGPDFISGWEWEVVHRDPNLRFNDDFWMTYYLEKKGVPRMVIPASGRPYSRESLFGEGPGSLWHSNRFRNDALLENYYPNEWRRD